MGILWENLEDVYKIHLKDICTPEEFEASSITERGQLRHQFLERRDRLEARKNQVHETTGGIETVTFPSSDQDPCVGSDTEKTVSRFENTTTSPWKKRRLLPNQTKQSRSSARERFPKCVGEFPSKDSRPRQRIESSSDNELGPLDKAQEIQNECNGRKSSRNREYRRRENHKKPDRVLGPFSPPAHLLDPAYINRIRGFNTNKPFRMNSNDVEVLALPLVSDSMKKDNLAESHLNGEDRKMAAITVNPVSTRKNQTQTTDEDSNSEFKSGSYATQNAPGIAIKREHLDDVESAQQSHRQAIREAEDEDFRLDNNDEYAVRGNGINESSNSSNNKSRSRPKSCSNAEDDQQDQPIIQVTSSSSVNPVTSSSSSAVPVAFSSSPEVKRELTEQSSSNIDDDQQNQSIISAISSSSAVQVAISSSPEVKRELTEQSSSNVDDDQQNQSIIPVISSSSGVPPEVKRELTEQELKAKYGRRLLLHRIHGVGMLGGRGYNTHQIPREHDQKIWNIKTLRPGYPLPKMALKKNAEGDDVYDMDAFSCLAYNTLMEKDGPKFAGQPTAAVSGVPNCMKRKGLALPFFMKRFIQTETLGWEYVGNYRCITDRDLVVYESAANFPEASKREIAEKLFKSAKAQFGEMCGENTLSYWRKFLNAELKNDENDAKSLSARARNLGFKSSMHNRDLAYLLVELDEFHGKEIIEFVEYDERIYEYCIKGPTTKNSEGKMHAKKGGSIAKAKDGY